MADFLRAALDDGACVGLITETCSAPGLGAADALLRSLGDGVAGAVRVFATTDCSREECEQGSSEEGGQWGRMGGGGGDTPLSLDEALAKAKAQAKRSAAELAAQAAGAGVIVDPALLAADGGRPSLLSPTFVSAVALTMGVPAAGCAVLAASGSVMEAARGAGQYCVAVPPSLSARGKFSAADVQFDGFGPGGGATWPRVKAQLLQRLEQRQQQA